MYGSLLVIGSSLVIILCRDIKICSRYVQCLSRIDRAEFDWLFTFIGCAVSDDRKRWWESRECCHDQYVLINNNRHWQIYGQRRKIAAISRRVPEKNSHAENVSKIAEKWSIVAMSCRSYWTASINRCEFCQPTYSWRSVTHLVYLCKQNGLFSLQITVELFGPIDTPSHDSQEVSLNWMHRMARRMPRWY